MEEQHRQREEKPAQRSPGGHQTDLAEGELDTVEESIRTHERKGDLAPGQAPEKPLKRKSE
jgi:hypothetical protein